MYTCIVAYTDQVTFYKVQKHSHVYLVTLCNEVNHQMHRFFFLSIFLALRNLIDEACEHDKISGGLCIIKHNTSRHKKWVKKDGGGLYMV